MSASSTLVALGKWGQAAIGHFRIRLVSLNGQPDVVNIALPDRVALVETCDAPIVLG
jgi:hypothetical protein